MLLGKSSRTFETGDSIPESGIYSVVHCEHRLPHEVTLLRHEFFPRCAKCGTRVRFKLLQAVPEANTPAALRVKLYELPVLDDVLPSAA